MDTKEKLVELLQHDNCPLFMVFGDKVDVLADYLIAHGVTVQEWISVKDRLPEEGIDVLIYNDEDREHYIPFFTGFLDRGTWYSSYEIYEEANFMEFMHVTHWQYLPQPPKGE